MNVKIVTHSTELTATRWTPTGGKIGHDIIPTASEAAAILWAAKLIVANALLGPTRYVTRPDSPGMALSVLTQAVR